MTNLEWIRTMEAEQLARDIIAPCDHHSCGECPVRSACDNKENAMEWLGEEHREADG